MIFLFNRNGVPPAKGGAENVDGVYDMISIA